MRLYLHGLLTLVFYFTFSICYAQVISNPSFEDVPEADVPPVGWYSCNEYSTPDTEPGPWDINVPPSDGYTYLFLVTRGNFMYDRNTVEAAGTSAQGTFTKGKCYSIDIDLSYYPSYQPIRLKIYLSKRPHSCTKDKLIWTSPGVSHEDWRTYSFTFTVLEDYTDLILEASYDNDFAPSYYYFGNISIDNLRLHAHEVDVKNEFTLCGDEKKIHIASGVPTGNLTWNDGTTESDRDIEKAGTYWYTYEQDNCTIKNTTTVYQCCEFSAPNVFTPNDDVFNTSFEVSSASEILNYDLSIFNRWGELVFESNKLSEFWDGKLNKQVDASNGVYYWQVSMKCKDHNKIKDLTYKGIVSVLR